MQSWLDIWRLIDRIRDHELTEGRSLDESDHQTGEEIFRQLNFSQVGRNYQLQ